MKFHWPILITLILIFSFKSGYSADSTKVDVNLDVKHLVGGISEFDRQKYIVLHSSLTEHDWKNETEKMNYVFGDLDVYLGRDNGGINWWLGQSGEDQNRPGFADSIDIINNGLSTKNSWASDSRNVFDNKSDVMIGGQTSTMWPGHKSGWELAGADAVGEYMARYVNEFYRDINDQNKNNGHPAPRFLEVLNEPLYELHDDPNIPDADKVDLIDVFRFHRDVARSFKKLDTTTKIGGYTVAFPEYDIDNFQRWDDRMKMFIDTAGADMDFYSIHLYDFNRHWVTGNTGHIHFKGSRTEATLDMLEEYGILKFGEVKPMVISEYAGRDHLLESQKVWSAEFDWQKIKAISPFLMQFMERPNNIVKTVPFIMAKAAWSASPHGSRLMRQTREPESYVQNDYNTDYVFTEAIKFYELWSDVKGTRVDVWSDNPDILAQGYVNGNKAYIIFSNLTFNIQDIDLKMMGLNGNSVQNVKVKHLYAVNDIPVLDVNTYNSLDKFTVKEEATAILEFTLNTEVALNQTSEESKFYATTFNQPIGANQALSFEMNGITKGNFGEGVLRLGFGREHSKSKKPIVKFNGTSLNVPDEIEGESQEYRESFFGLLKIPVPFDLIHENNTVSVTFPDDGGRVSSVTMQVFNFTRKIVRSNSVDGVSLYPVSINMGVGQERLLTATITPSNAADTRASWRSSDESVVTVDESGKITGHAVGSALITVTSLDGGFEANCNVTVQSDRVEVVVDKVTVSPSSADLILEETIQLSSDILPIDVDSKTLTWSSDDESVATVDQNGFVTAIADGVAEIRATANNGIYGSCSITAKTKVPGAINFDDQDKYLQATYAVGGTLDITCNFTATTGNVVNKDGVKFWLREIKPGWTVANDYTAIDYTAAGKESGTATASISLENVPATSEIPSDNWYFLFLTFTNSDGSSVNKGIFPINIVRTTGIGDVAVGDKLKIFPNPAKNTVNIQADFQFDKITLYNLAGMVVLSKYINGNSLDVSFLHGGLYLVEVSGDIENEVARLVIKQ